MPARSGGAGPQPRTGTGGARGGPQGAPRRHECALAGQGNHGRRYAWPCGRPVSLRRLPHGGVVPRDEPKRRQLSRARGESRPAGRHAARKWKKIEVVDLPMPSPLYFEGQRLPASYANFYIANAAVLMPTFNDPKDRVALGILAELIRDRPVVGIHAVDLVWGLGTLHCLTQQEPAVSAT